MSQSGSLIGSGGGGGGSIQTINGDTGSITGSTVTIYADNTANNSGSSVEFVNSGTISKLNVTDANFNTCLGKNSGSLTQSGISNTSLGYGNLNVITTGSGNCSYGYGTLPLLTTGSGNSSFGLQNAQSLTTGSRNTTLGGNQSGSNYTTESDNTVVGNAGVPGDNNVMRLGTQGSGEFEIDECFIAGIVGVTTSNSEMVTIDSTTGQMGVAPIPGGSATAFYAFCSANKTNVTGNGVSYTVLFDSTQRNDGTAFNTGTGNFTAPKTGLYNFTANIALEGLDVTSTSILIAIQGSAFDQFTYSVGSGSVNGSGNYFSSASWIIPMTAGDTVNILVNAAKTTQTVSVGGGAFGSNISSSFAGYFIGT